MPIYDYEKVCETAKRSLLERKDVSDINKEYVLKFLPAYKHKGKSVSPARKGLFLRHLIPLLKKSKDIKQEMLDRDTINKMYSELENELKGSHYATCVDVSLRFVKWLYDDLDNKKPPGYRDISYIKSSKRNLEPKDMILWQDGLTMISKTNSVQLKAIIMTQLDGGFRPSEFIDIKYSDIEKSGKYLVAKVSGKTGKREVFLWKCIPYLQRWLDQHPDKKPESPLWIKENNKGKDYSKYDYFAIRKRVIQLGKRAGINKPLDFYNFRHSSAKMKKDDNVPLDLAAENMGHSVKFFTEVYGRLSREDKAKRYDKVNGQISKRVQEQETNKICQFCGTINEPLKDYCEKCNNPLTMDVAVRETQKAKDMEEKYNRLQEQIDMLSKLIEIKGSS